MAKQTKKLPRRDQVRESDRWDLASLFPDDNAWEKFFKKWEKRISKFKEFRGTLSDSPAALKKCLDFDLDFERQAERLGTYAFLKTAEDTANSTYQRMMGRFRHAASEAAEEASFIRPEILSIPKATMERFLSSRPLSAHKLSLQRVLRFKPHSLSKREERLLAMQGEMSQSTNQIFRQLTDADLKFGTVKNEQGEVVELAHSSFSALLHSPRRSVRKTAFHQYYGQYQAHENSLAATLSGSIQRDVYYAKARGYKSSLDAALFPDQVPPAVYENLIASVRKHLPSLYRYLEIRRRGLRLKEIHHYDTYVPILSELETRHSWKQAAKKVIDSLRPLGSGYCGTLEAGLNGRWCDRYANSGKQSGAFSCGSFDAEPYILMNFESSVLDHVFTLAHEAGHSMHSYYSARHQPFQYYDYTIFVAEVASTFNEQLLSRYLMGRARNGQERAYLVNREIDAIRGTIIRQTMFAEFEKISHELVETGEPLTVEKLKSVYRELLEAYFGPDFVLDEQLSLECLRIPHFYRAFYVYKYATGMSAAMALSERVLTGGETELDDYLSFLKAGCSKDPLDLLRDAGVDMERPEPVEAALSRFGELVAELDELL